MLYFIFFFFNDTATTEIYTLSLHDALPIYVQSGTDAANWLKTQWTTIANGRADVSVSLFTHASTVSPQPSVIATITGRSEEHTSELQSRQYLVCRLLLEKKKSHYQSYSSST